MHRSCHRAFFALVFCFFAQAVAAKCNDATVWLRGEFGSARFNVEIADTNRERAIGLMNRPSMAASEGMLFVYPRPQPLSFWMRNTLISLDMLFLDPTGTVTKIHHEAVPLDETPIPGGDGLTHVLEINGGLARMMGIQEGTQMRHPSFDQDIAVWPC
ncbi:hypothetical protein GCM10007385_33270 [Tateyamaria omphalii]|uniref:DUF192 domain-containing protein n=1 Tax=Tateyamaria omphalii TaxID=299262 RepID=UPI00167341E7|nr:DUF192 domain-containing protein [Tateyamaria omphalii]GGX61525.1 hypothetical protein GCM10007385_33270 [Tateyamaria omphalii]